MIKPSVYLQKPLLYKAAADYVLVSYQQAIKDRDAFHIALSGGTTPKNLYQLIAENLYQSQFDWKKVHIYFGDERFVPEDHEQSNYRMAAETLLNHVAIPQTNVHKIPTNVANAETSAKLYGQYLEKHLPIENQFPSFDLVLLGLGTDGHTASLFPDSDALNETQKYCHEVYVDKLDSWRISITFPIINHARHILLLSEGESKAEIISDLIHNQSRSERYPIELVNPMHEMAWYIDIDAAKLI